MAEPFSNITVVLKNGATNERPISSGKLIIEAGGANTAALTGYLVMTGGTNSGAVTGAANIAGATNSGFVSGDVFLSDGILATGANVGGKLHVAGANSVVPSGILVSGQIILSSNVYLGNLGVLSNYSGTVISKTGENTLESRIYMNGATGFATTLTDAVYYNLEGDDKAYHYNAGAKEVFTGNAYNLTGDGKAYSWSGGVKGAVFVGTLYTGTEGEAGYTRIVIDGSDNVTITAVDHQYSTSGNYYDTDPITDGATVYTGQYTDDVATSGSFTIGTNGTQGYGTVSIGATGIASIAYVDHSSSVYDGITSTVYFDNTTPIVGDIMYTGQYSTTASSSSFSFYIGVENVAGYKLVVVTSGVVASVTDVNHPYSLTTTNSVTIYFNSATPAQDDAVYTGQYTDAKYTTAFTAYSGTEGTAGYARITQAATTGTVSVEAADHQGYITLPGGSTSIYFDGSSLYSGITVYTGRYTFALASNTSWSSGTDGMQGYTVYNVTAGVYTSTAVFHQYTTTYDGMTYYHAAANITAGSTVFSNQYTLSSYPAEGTIFVAGTNKITIGASGAATVTPINHAYSYPYTVNNSTYTAYGDAATLTNGDVLYTGQYSIIPVPNIPLNTVGTEGTAGYGTFTTNNSGVVDGTFVNHPYVYITGGIAADSALPTAIASAITLQTYVNRYSMQPAAATTFRVGGLVYTIESNGNLSTVTSFSGFENGEVWVSGERITGEFTGPTYYVINCDDNINTPTLRLVKTGLNIGDKVYKTETKNMTGNMVEDFGAYAGTFLEGTEKYTVSAGSITAIHTCTSYLD